ncbi:helix-turn-helix domain-containing protein [Achromobacter aegrifaciens]|uniref:helix-turn-helix domain-containing protein n=1 Tax=Achromobacter aegrifaciens TaxID=1287736 RepID=UPI0028AA3455|nr:helix-turn-helix domain-containing protein [Achromobacter aegrifaciens]
MKTLSQLSDTGIEDLAIGLNSFDEQVGHPLALAYVVVLICREGSAEWEVNFKPHRMKKNDLLVLAEDSIALIKRKSDDYSCACYLMNRSIAAEIAHALPNSLFSFLSRSPFFAAEKLSPRYSKAWEGQAALIHEQCVTYQRTMIVNHVQNLFLWICEKTDGLGAGMRNDFSRSEAVCWKFWELISMHCVQQRGVAFYAGLLHITPYYLSQLSRRFFNDAPKTLIDRQVVLEIKKRLTQPRKSVQEIAEELHFADASYLGKFFKRHTGVGLTDYRKGRA